MISIRIMDYLSRRETVKSTGFTLFEQLQELESKAKKQFLIEFDRLLEDATSEEKYDLFFVLLIVDTVATKLLLRHLEVNEKTAFSQQAIKDFDMFFAYCTYPSQTRQEKFHRSFYWANLEHLLGEEHVRFDEKTMRNNCKKLNPS